MNIQELGIVNEIFVTSRPDGNSLIVGGTLLTTPNEDSNKWTRVLSHRAGQILWYRLTLLLFPERASEVTARVSTAPLRPTGSLPTVTTHVEVAAGKDDTYHIKGTAGDDRWIVTVSGMEIRRMWAALDVALYPAGWEGGERDTSRLPKPRQSYQ
ncbi:MAG: hypothetical protein BroJett018_19460 [Chloroflexota bacterium]|nr:hypothetical protein [Chloroflexota bacterium]NOG62459.1 hypothetical protein [Chloroflexota bacterium]GIK64152.1 MAG: hypothetical protein BroJett018_19460 [Chloroflexota bacterium]